MITERFKSLFGPDETQEQFGKRVGISRNTIAQYYNGKRKDISSEALTKICKACDVSADWLLGLSEVKRPDADLQAVCEYTGLCEAASIKLHQDITISDILNIFILANGNEKIKTCIEEMLKTMTHYALYEDRKDESFLQRLNDITELYNFKASRSFTNFVDTLHEAYLIETIFHDKKWQNVDDGIEPEEGYIFISEKHVNTFESLKSSLGIDDQLKALFEKYSLEVRMNEQTTER